MHNADYQFDFDNLPDCAGVSTWIVVRMILAHPVSKEAAMKVLATLSQQTGQDYTLDNVAVKLIEEVYYD